MNKYFFNLLTTVVFTSHLCIAAIKYDLVEVVKVNPAIRTDIRYATTNNFTGKPVYPSARCYVRKSVAQKLDRIQKKLEQQGLGLKIWDGYRPFSVQEIFWDICPDARYVGQPVKALNLDGTEEMIKGSKHNRGSAIDLTIVDLKTGNEVKMPSEFDDFSEKAHRDYSKMDAEAAKNCKLLEDLMKQEGFIPLDTEWWHFDDENWQQCPLLDVTFDQLEQN